jgi:hypothetical protein
VDKLGRRIIEPQFAYAEPYLFDYARVSVEPSFAYIGIAGTVIWDPREARGGFWDLTLQERIRVESDPRRYTFERVAPPPYREPASVGYPPEHLYDEELPGWPMDWPASQ